MNSRDSSRRTRYYDNKAKEVYELKMGSKTDEYMTNVLELLRYVPYLKDENGKLHIFLSRLSLTFGDWIEYDELQLLEEIIGKSKHCYEQSMCKTRSQHGWKGKEKGKGKWKPKRKRPLNEEAKENVAPYKKFNIARWVHGLQQQNKSDGTGWLQCWTCGKEHLRRDCV